MNHPKFGATSGSMAAVGLDWVGVETFARKAVKLLQEHGSEFVDMIAAGFRAFRAVTNRDFPAVFLAINEIVVDVNKLATAIREEFGLEG